MTKFEEDPENSCYSEHYTDPDALVVDACRHSFNFFFSGTERLTALLNLIGNANDSLKMCFYIFQADRAGQLLLQALVLAAQRGVSVQLIVDAFGSSATQTFFTPFQKAGGTVHFFQSRWNTHYLIRNHQKFIIADNEVVMTGGFNIGDRYFSSPKSNSWCDVGVIIKGDVVAKFVEWFGTLNQWVISPRPKFFELNRSIQSWSNGKGKVQLLMGGPSQMTSAWARAVKRDLAKAQNFDLAMAYFSPPRSIRRLIRKVSRKGRANLVIAGKSDNPTTLGASRALYGTLLKDNVEISEFKRCKLHMKLLVIDNITYFGSANFDFRSIRLNIELMVRVEDNKLATEMRNVISTMAEKSEHITQAWYKRRASIINRVRWRISWFLVSVIDYTVARRLNVDA